MAHSLPCQIASVQLTYKLQVVVVNQLFVFLIVIWLHGTKEVHAARNIESLYIFLSLMTFLSPPVWLWEWSQDTKSWCQQRCCWLANWGQSNRACTAVTAQSATCVLAQGQLPALFASYICSCEEVRLQRLLSCCLSARNIYRYLIIINIIINKQLLACLSQLASCTNLILDVPCWFSWFLCIAEHSWKSLSDVQNEMCHPDVSSFVICLQAGAYFFRWLHPDCIEESEVSEWRWVSGLRGRRILTWVAAGQLLV